MVKTMRLVSLLVALMWAPVTSHCLLETLPGLEFLHCDGQGDAPESEDCAKDVCQSVESGDYRVQDNPDLFEFFAWITDIKPLIPTELPLPVSRGGATAGQHDLAGAWHFIFRTALPPRAPSLAS